MTEVSHEGAYRLIHQRYRTPYEAQALRSHLRVCGECRRHAAAAAFLTRQLAAEPARRVAPPEQATRFLRRATRQRRRNLVIRPLNSAAALAAITLIVVAGWLSFRSTARLVGHDSASAPHNSTLITAVPSGDAAAVERLLSPLHNAEFRDDRGTALLPLAARAGRVEVVQLLLGKGADVNATAFLEGAGKTALMEAALNNRPEVVKLLIDAGAYIDQQEAETGFTALSHASSQSNEDVVRALLENGANPNLRAHNGWSPLYQAARFAYVDTARALLDAGADVDLPDNDGLTPLMVAIIRGRVIDLSVGRITTLLLLRGADPNRQDKDGNTALHHAALSGMTDAVPILIEHGASLAVKNRQGKTPLDLAAYDLTRETMRAAATKAAQPDG